MPQDYLLCLTQCHRTTYFVLHHRTTYFPSRNATGLLTLHHTMPLDYLLYITQCRRINTNKTIASTLQDHLITLQHFKTITSTLHQEHRIITMPLDYLLCVTQCHWTTYFVSHNATGLLPLYHTMPPDYFLCIKQCHWTTYFMSHNDIKAINTSTF